MFSVATLNNYIGIVNGFISYNISINSIVIYTYEDGQSGWVPQQFFLCIVSIVHQNVMICLLDIVLV